jgi:hypothetical protein
MTTQFRSYNGAWRVASDQLHRTGDTVTVTRRNGSDSTVIIGNQIAHDPNLDLPYLYEFTDMRVARGAQAAEHTVVVPNAERLFALFERAASHREANRTGRGIAVRFQLSNTARGLRIEANARGQLMALSDQRMSTGRRMRYGSLDRDGRFRGNVGPTEIERIIFNEVADVLQRFAADPAGYAGAHGQATGNCCFCGRGLTDERSVAVGYGPICADYYGLPWGDATAPAFDVQQGSRQLERLTDNAGRENAFDNLVSDIHDDRLAAAAVARVQDLPSGTPVDPRHTNAQGEIINRTLYGIETATGEQLDAWGRQYAVERQFMSDLDYRHAILQSMRRMAQPDDMDTSWTISAVAAELVPAGAPVTVDRIRPDQVVTTVRRVRPAATPPAVAPAPPRSVRPRAPRLTGLRNAQPQGQRVPEDETVTTVVRAVRRDPNTPLEEDDFVWPPRNTGSNV